MRTSVYNYIISVIFLLSGVGFIIGSFVVRSTADNFIKNGIQIDAKIVSIVVTGSGEDTHHHCFVEYTLDGINYRNELNHYNSAMKEGQMVPIRYLPEDPNKIAYAKNEFFLFWFFLIGGVFTLVSSALFLVFLHKKRKKVNSAKLES